MPLTELQREIFRLLAHHRNPNSFIAGGTLLHRRPDSPRFSRDIDVFHDAQESVALAAEADLLFLGANQFQVERTLVTPNFQRATITKGGQAVKLEWALDSAFRFFPVQPDEEFGYALHLADAATNKVLALAGRWEARDFIDVLYLHDQYASLGLLAWAAAGKDAGITPAFILEQAARFNRMQGGDFTAVLGTGSFDLPQMKQDWLVMLETAQKLITDLPSAEAGCLYLDQSQRIVNPLESEALPHFGSVGGAFPRLGFEPICLSGQDTVRADFNLRSKYPKREK